MEYMFRPYARYFDFGGRSCRSEYWMYTLFLVSVSLVLLILSGALDGFLLEDPYASADLEDVGMLALVWVVFMLFSMIPSLAVTVRRFHDIGMSGWAYVGLALFSLIPLIGLLGSLAIFVITVLPSKEGDNQWGENPHGFGDSYHSNMREDYRTGGGVRYR